MLRSESSALLNMERRDEAWLRMWHVSQVQRGPWSHATNGDIGPDGTMDKLWKWYPSRWNRQWELDLNAFEPRPMKSPMGKSLELRLKLDLKCKWHNQSETMATYVHDGHTCDERSTGGQRRHGKALRSQQDSVFRTARPGHDPGHAPNLPRALSRLHLPLWSPMETSLAPPLPRYPFY
ncbi:hypothetical protein BCR44DRAFT_346390 [Catenaria anguillulae PL171]|uniref:Uncharacterized protein n=1 Tax=Catenaria anguillulae PL171 TaxID=765915 RepID=A0A1Y2H603_9FUNG|nr:hypothetical protein BCR44DRAFT_346390 [Catenaria anguillulae PL171]